MLNFMIKKTPVQTSNLRFAKRFRQGLGFELRKMRL
jgi:hypothetical protein